MIAPYYPSVLWILLRSSPDDGREDEATEADAGDGQAEGDGPAQLEVLTDDHHRRDVGQAQTDTCRVEGRSGVSSWSGSDGRCTLVQE